MSDLGTVAFDTSEKVDILIKDAFNVSSTNESTPWYLETNATYNTYINGEDILVDEIPKSIDWANCESLTADEMLSLYNLTSSDSLPAPVPSEHQINFKINSTNVPVQSF